MLNAKETLTILQAAQAMRLSKDPTLAPHATALDGLLLATAQARASMGAASTGRPAGAGAGAMGRPGRAFAIALEPGWQAQRQGAQAATDLVNETLTEHKLRKVSVASIQQAISRNGTWARVLETDNGQAALTVRRA